MGIKLTRLEGNKTLLCPLSYLLSNGRSNKPVTANPTTVARTGESFSFCPLQYTTRFYFF